MENLKRGGKEMPNKVTISKQIGKVIVIIVEAESTVSSVQAAADAMKALETIKVSK